MCHCSTDAPTELVDCGKAFVAYIDAVKKEYDVRTTCI